MCRTEAGDECLRTTAQEEAMHLQDTGILSEFLQSVDQRELQVACAHMHSYVCGHVRGYVHGYVRGCVRACLHGYVRAHG